MTEEEGRLAEVRRLRPRRRWSQWPLAVVLLGVAAGLVLIVLDQVRPGTITLAASLLVALVLRLSLPAERAGMLVVRSRPTDLVVLGLLATGLGLLAVWVPAAG